MKLDKELIKGTSKEFNTALKECKKAILDSYKKFLKEHSHMHPDFIKSLVKTESEDFDLTMRFLFEPLDK